MCHGHHHQMNNHIPNTTPPQRKDNAVLTADKPAAMPQFIDIPPMSHPPDNTSARNEYYSWQPPTPPSGSANQLQVLLRKEVIQPHLPVRLPCYDLVPIASPTFDGSLPKRG